MFRSRERLDLAVDGIADIDTRLHWPVVQCTSARIVLT